MTENADTTVDQTTDQTTSTTDAATDTASYHAPTKDELDRMLAAARKRERERFGDYADLKTKAAEFDQLQEAQKTELEKAQERAAQLEQQAKDATARAHEALLRSAVVAEAARKNVVDPDAAFALIDRSSLQFADDGTPINVAEAMDSLLTAKPYLAGGNGRTADLGARDRGAVGEQLGREDAKSMTPEEIVAARKAGKFDDALAGKT